MSVPALPRHRLHSPTPREPQPIGLVVRSILAELFDAAERELGGDFIKQAFGGDADHYVRGVVVALREARERRAAGDLEGPS